MFPQLLLEVPRAVAALVALALLLELCAAGTPEPTRLDGGGYAVRTEAYEAAVDTGGRLSSPPNGPNRIRKRGKSRVSVQDLVILVDRVDDAPHVRSEFPENPIEDTRADEAVGCLRLEEGLGVIWTSSVPALDGKPVRMEALREAGVRIFDYRGTRDPIAPPGSCVASELWGGKDDGNVSVTRGGLNRTIEKNVGHIFVVSKQLLAEYLELVSAFLEGGARASGAE